MSVLTWRDVAQPDFSSVTNAAPNSTAAMNNAFNSIQSSLQDDLGMKTTTLQANPFYVLGVSSRDDRRKIVEMAEERALLVDHDTCHKSRSDLTNPRTRLSVEMAWMPGVAPGMAEKLVTALSDDRLSAFCLSVFCEEELPKLARANLMAAAFELLSENEPAKSIQTYISKFAWMVDSINSEDVLRYINEDRAVSGFPEVNGIDVIEEELAERRKAYCSALKKFVDTMDPVKLVETITNAVAAATDSGRVHGPALIDDLVDVYEVETQGFLEQEYENLSVLIERARSAAPNGHRAIAPIIDRLEKVARNWDRVAQPIQLSAKSRGIAHDLSRNVAFELRSFGIDLFNKYGMLDQADRMTQLLEGLFAELPEVAERLAEDATAIDDLRRQALTMEKNKAQWERDITFRAEIGLLFKDKLSISPDGIRWKGSVYSLESITRVRWGAVRKSVNGIPTGTDYTIGFGDNRSEQVIQLNKESTYSGFLNALWRGVCVRLVLNMLAALKEGQSFAFGDITFNNDEVILVKHKFFGANEHVTLSWHEVNVWSHDGSFRIADLSDSKTYGSASYIHASNTHIFEHIISGALKKGVFKLSDHLKD